MLSKKAQILVDAGLPCPPTVLEFIKGLREYVQSKETPAPENELFGALFEDSSNGRKPPGTEKARNVAIAAALEFETLRIQKKTFSLKNVMTGSWHLQNSH